MSTLLDCRFEALRDQGFTGAVPDMMLQWLQDGGATATNIPDAWREFLVAEGYTQYQRSDAWWSYLDAQAPADVGRHINDLETWFWCENGGALAGLLFSAPLQSSLIPSRAKGSAIPTFSRASVATVRDFEGVVRAVNSGEARFQGARRVENRCPYSEDFSNGAWTLSNATKTAGQTDPDGGTTATRITATASNGRLRLGVPSSSTSLTYANSIWVRRVTAVTAVQLVSPDSSTSTDITPELTTEWQRFTVSSVANANANGYIGINISISGEAVDVAFAQQEDITGASVTTPSEYISTGVLSAPYHGAGVDAVKSFIYANGNSVASNVVTEAQGAAFDETDSYCDEKGPFGYQSDSGIAAADDDLTYNSTDNISSAVTTIALDFAPSATGLGTISMWGSYVDASNYTKIFHDGTNIVFRRRISGTNYDATKALTYAADTVYKIVARLDDADGSDVFIDGVKGTNQADTSAMQLGSDFGVGSDGNSSEQPDSAIRMFNIYGKALSDAAIAAFSFTVAVYGLLFNDAANSGLLGAI